MVRTVSERMRRWAAAVLSCLLAAPAAQALEVFTCEPEWAALVKALAPQARVTSATHTLQDPHHIEARPALIGALRRADIAVCTGASLEAGWLPMLQQRAGNARVFNGRDGMFYAADHVTLMHDHAHTPLDRSLGDVHAEGNPHLHLDPHKLKQVAQALADRLARIDPAGAAGVRQRHAAWVQAWDQHIARWEKKAEPLMGHALVAQHTTFAYLWEWLGLTQVADLEPKPGLPPTLAHLQRVLKDVAEDPPRFIVQASYQDPQAGRWLAARTGLPLKVLPATVTEQGRSATLEGLFDELIDQLLDALRASEARTR
ncbi:MAG: zinc ABC transporter substrate-binding protein [Caldimonas manganoxidans]|nr:zinc ABC transporter substrate-binding protein [Caldimonas manganoxidans]